MEIYKGGGYVLQNINEKRNNKTTNKQKQNKIQKVFIPYS